MAKEEKTSAGGAPSDEVKTDEVKTVPMQRDPEQFPPPHKADVHPDEVANWQKTGWVLSAVKEA